MSKITFISLAKEHKNKGIKKNLKFVKASVNNKLTIKNKHNRKHNLEEVMKNVFLNNSKQIENWFLLPLCKNERNIQTFKFV